MSLRNEVLQSYKYIASNVTRVYKQRYIRVIITQLKPNHNLTIQQHIIKAMVLTRNNFT